MPLTITPVTPGSLSIAAVSPGPIYNYSSYIAAVLADSPRGHWRLGESSGTFADSSGNAHTATGVGGVTYSATGALPHEGDAAVTLNGSTGYLQVTDHADLDLGDVFTLECWVKRSAIGTNDAIFSKGTNAYFLFIDAGNFVQLQKQSVSNVAASTVLITDTTTWHYVVASKTGATVKLYVDAVECTGAVTNATFADTATDLFLGATSGLDAAYMFSGSVDEIAVYPTALSAARVSAHYAAAGYSSTAALAVASPATLSISPVSPS